ncbi:amino acid/amide ABC transporter substrate-binding protein, HAAT family [Roseovarius pacificus]|uniref:Amino acid/amide ABC transporter substrate-binding protein, HAAT family n=2 Tax=Roseovarius pacificus TaxID=337701 RepID=A0A1M7GZ77_9RHOB|nr:amino acid/amide ABC transporter substrate-binding protein, HAAT family [Roseovarius pacificus]
MKLSALAFGASALAMASAASADTMTVGLVGPLSGGAAAWGSAMKAAIEFAAEDINAAGGLEVGGKTYTIDIAAYDSHYNPNDALTAVNRLVFEDEAAFIVGPLGSAPLAALVPTTTENKKITITAGFTPVAAAPEYPYSFRAVLPTEVYAKPQINWVVKSLGAEKIGSLFPNDETGQAMSNDISSAYEAAGADASAVEFYERGRVDFVPLLTRLLAQGIDTFELDGSPPQTAGLLVRQLRELGFEGNIVRTGGDATNDILAVAGPDASEGLYVHMEFDGGLDSVQDYQARYIEAYGGTMNAFSPLFYSNINMVFEAMKAAGTISDADAIVAEMAKISGYEGPAGEVSWIGEDFWGTKRQQFVPYAIGKVTGGKPEVVATCTVDACE